MTHTPASLIRFRDRVADAFRAKQIRSPVHFPSDSQAEPLVSIFKEFRPGDWCFSGWRSMWHCLLAGMPEEELFDMILQGRSMYVMSAKYRIFCSSIVGGILPVALGVAWAIKQNVDELRQARAGEMYGLPSCEPPPRVWVFIGDMTMRTGLYHEFFEYARGHCLPVHVVLENNGLSTNTPTDDVWGRRGEFISTYYNYTRSHPHVGLTERVNF